MSLSLKELIFNLFLTSALMWHFLVFLFCFVFFFIQWFSLYVFFSHWCTSGLIQWIAWIRRVPTMASVWMGSVTVSQAGVGSTASCPEPSAQTSAMVMGPSYQTLGCAAVTPTGWDLTALWVGTTVGLVWLKESLDLRWSLGCEKRMLLLTT